MNNPRIDTDLKLADQYLDALAQCSPAWASIGWLWCDKHIDGDDRARVKKAEDKLDDAMMTLEQLYDEALERGYAKHESPSFPFCLRRLDEIEYERRKLDAIRQQVPLATLG